jgi:1-acyl-sn-glycerol-3-phosphate acyltransferase
VVWRLVCAVSGGLTISGQRQVRGGCVLVANHNSHADTAVLMAALPAGAKPVFVAAADYWFDVPVRRFLATSLAAILPVDRNRGGGYAAMLAAAKPALAAGRTVVIFPEGTRSANGRIGKFHSGAVRLARDCGVPLIPAAVTGTDEVLPKGGRFSRGAMHVRFGKPIKPAVASPEYLRAHVVALKSRKAVTLKQVIRPAQRIQKRAASPRVLVAA